MVAQSQLIFRRVAWMLTVLSLLIKFFFLGKINLIPEEAYYWMYAQNLDYGYLDHPPLVALTIYVGELLCGTSEFGVRIGAVFWWAVAGFFVYRLSMLMHGYRAALAALLLYALLPVYFGVGFFMSPDAPLCAFWAASVYYLYRVLVLGEERLWWMAGICLGVGMLAKYTLALVGLAVLVFMVIDPAARREFLRPRPYLAAVSALICFAPVLLWNMEHEWASFAFQSTERLAQKTKFSLPSLLAFMILTLMPTGMIVFAQACRIWIKALGGWKTPHETSPPSFSPCSMRFIAAMTLVPLIVFVFFSLTKAVKVNWLGPVFIPFLPVMGASLAGNFVKDSAFERGMRQAWFASFVLVLIGFAGFFSYLGLNIPGVPYSSKMHKFMAGRELAREIISLEEAWLQQTGRQAVVVGMDKHYLASQLSFYRSLLDPQRKNEPVVGRHIFGRESLMHRYWTSPKLFDGRDMILVSRSIEDLSDKIVSAYFQRVSGIESIVIERNGNRIYELFYRVGESYKKA